MAITEADLQAHERPPLAPEEAGRLFFLEMNNLGTQLKGHIEFPAKIAGEFMKPDPDTGMYTCDVPIGSARYHLIAQQVNEEGITTRVFVLTRRVQTNEGWDHTSVHLTSAQAGETFTGGTMMLNHKRDTPQTTDSTDQIPKLFPELYPKAEDTPGIFSAWPD